jgi:hypothetical protein
MIKKLSCSLFGILLTLYACTALAASLYKDDVLQCTYIKATFSSNGDMKVACQPGAVTTVTTFTLSTSPSGSTTTGTPVTLNVTRNVTGTPGTDVVNIAAGGVATSSNALTQVTFLPTDVSGSVKPAGNVTFSGAGTATFTGSSPTGGIVTPITITISSTVQTAGCEGITAAPLTKDLGTLSGAGSYGDFVIKPIASHGNFAVGVFKFTVPADAPDGQAYQFVYEQTNAAANAFAPKTTALSDCAGDFTGTRGVSGGSAVCTVDASGVGPNDAIRFRVPSTSTLAYCRLDKNKPYYLNVKGRISGETIGFVLGTQKLSF